MGIYSLIKNRIAKFKINLKFKFNSFDRVLCEIELELDLEFELELELYLVLHQLTTKEPITIHIQKEQAINPRW